MRSPAIRLALTLALPLLLVLAADHILLPGMEDALGTLGRRAGDFFTPSRANMSVFALGIMPVLTAYAIVELASFIVPRWSRLRHGNPEGRAKLERAARVIAIVLAAFQAWSIAKTIAGLDLQSGMFATGADLPPSWLVVVTLVAGVCVQIVVAELISRQGIANGYVALIVIESLAQLPSSIAAQVAKARFMDVLTTQHVVLLGLVVALPLVATWCALRGGDRVRVLTAQQQDGTTGPYRAARALAVSPWVPVPSSSISPYPMALALVSLPISLLYLLGARHASNDFATFMAEPLPFAIALVTLTGGLAAIFARLLHRPREMADVASRLGFKGGEEVAAAAHAALKAAFVPTLLLFATLLAASSAGSALPVRVSISFLPLLVALVMDVVAGLRTAKLVVVWQERRASVVPVVRAVLAAEGIDARVRGLSVLSLLQVFAPYAPAEIVVEPADAERATSILRQVFLGEKRTEKEPAGDLRPQDEAVPWTPARRNVILGVTTALALGALALANVRTRSPEVAPGPPHRLEIVRVDDESDVMGQLDESALPSGIEIYFENAPAGPGHTVKVQFARTMMRSGETFDAAFARLRAWADTLVLPPGRRIGLEPIDEYDPDTNKASLVGVRTFVLQGAPVISGDDIVDAAAATNDTSGIPEVYVAVTLSQAGGERFRIATRELVQRRFAIVVDDRINSVPVVKSEIAGGHLSITMGAGDPDHQLVQARALARSLRRNHE